MASRISTSSFPITLRPAATPDAASDSLPQLVQRIATQRDGLKNVTEAKLLEEIAEEEVGIQKSATAEEEDHEPKDALTQQKELWAAKNELLTYIDQLRNPVGMALDLLSLQIRDQARTQAEQTLGAFVKGAMPVGGMGLDKVEPQAPDPNALESDTVTATGWSLQNLARNADRLLQSAQKLNQEVEKEARYWQEVSEVRRKGWSIARIPRQRSTVGVKFGFSEAGPLFQAQSLAALRADDDGRIILDRGLMREHKAVRVRVVEGDCVLGESRGPGHDAEGSDIESRIHQARDSLFEDELFHEMTCEARSLLAYNVKLVDDAIRVPISNPASTQERHLVISVEPPDTPAPRDHSADTDSHATAIALACRVLLTHVYRQRFRRRSKPPLPLSNEKENPRTSDILRPLLSLLHHRAAVARLTHFGTTLSTALNAAGIPFSHKLTIPPPPTAQTGKTPMEAVVDSMLSPHGTSFALTLEPPTADSSPYTLTLKTTTALSDPTYGTEFQLIRGYSASEAEDEPRPPKKFDDIEDLLQYLRRAICSLIMERLAERQETWRVGPERGPELRKIGGEDEKGRKRLTLTMQEKELTLGGGTVGGRTGVVARWPGSERGLAEVVAKL